MSKSLIVAVVAATAFAAPAMAYQLKTQADGDQVRISHLPLARVNFNDPREAKAFYTKVKRAAADVCTIPSMSSTISRADADCVARAVAEAVRWANRPLLTAAYDSDQSSSDALAGNDQ